MAFPDPGDFERAVEQRAREVPPASDPGPMQPLDLRQRSAPGLHGDLDASRDEYLAKLRARLAALQSARGADSKGRTLVASLGRLKEQVTNASMGQEHAALGPDDNGGEEAAELLHGGMKDVREQLSVAEKLSSDSSSSSSESSSDIDSSSDSVAGDNPAVRGRYASLDDMLGAEDWVDSAESGAWEEALTSDPEQDDP